MVVIERIDEYRSALWVDGFLPSRASLSERYDDLSQELPDWKLKEDIGCYRRDQLFFKLLEPSISHSQRLERPGLLPIWNAIYILQPTRGKATLSSTFPSLYRELSGEKRPGHRSLIVVYDSEPEGSEPFKSRTAEVTRLLQRYGFEIKKGPYFKYEDFQHDVHSLLDKALEPFLTPRYATATILQSQGFRLNYFPFV